MMIKKRRVCGARIVEHALSLSFFRLNRPLSAPPAAPSLSSVVVALQHVFFSVLLPPLLIEKVFVIQSTGS